MNAEKTGDFIRSLRKDRNLTQKQLADLIHVSDKAVSRWETGRGFPDIGNLEDLAEALDVSAAELLKGERYGSEITEADIIEASAAGLYAARKYVSEKKWLNLSIGFLAGMILLMLAVIHLTSPVPLTDPERALAIDMLSDHEVIAVLNESVSGYDLNTESDPDTGESITFISCSDTLWDRITGRHGKMIIPLGNKKDLGYVYYYPTAEGDKLIWKNDRLEEPSGGIVTLPRLVFHYWLIIAIFISFLGFCIFRLNRRSRYAGTLFRAAALPASFAVSAAAATAGRSGEIYNASHYLSGILLLTIFLYVLFLILFQIYSTRKQNPISSEDHAKEKQIG